MIDHLSKNEARDKTPLYGEEGDVMGFSRPSVPFHSFTSCAKQSSQKVLYARVARQEFYFQANLSGGFDSSSWSLFRMNVL